MDPSPIELDNSGTGPLRVPGFNGIPLFYEQSKDNRFAHGIADWRQIPQLFLRELSMLQFMSYVTNSQTGKTSPKTRRHWKDGISTPFRSLISMNPHGSDVYRSCETKRLISNARAMLLCLMRTHESSNLKFMTSFLKSLANPCRRFFRNRDLLRLLPRMIFIGVVLRVRFEMWLTPLCILSFMGALESLPTAAKLIWRDLSPGDYHSPRLLRFPRNHPTDTKRCISKRERKET